MRSVMQRYNSIKIYIGINSEFVAGDKCANKSVALHTLKSFDTDLREWYVCVVALTLASLEEF